MSKFQKKVSHFRYGSADLSRLLKTKPQYGANEAGIERISYEQPRYIRITDVDQYGILKKGMGKTISNFDDKFLLNNNDILFARSGATVGKSYIHKENEISYPCYYAGYMIRFVMDEDKACPDYIFTYTQLETYQEWVLATQRAAGQPNINAEEYKSLKIPIPPKEIQAQIVAKMDAAYANKKQKEAQAQQLLASIDDYLLAELGIELPQATENTIQNRIFTRRLSDVTGGRFDAINLSLKDYETSLFTGCFNVIKLRQLVLNIKTGTTPHNKLEPYSNNGIPFLRNINLKNGELELTNIKFIKSSLKKQLTYSYEDEVIICIAGTVGDSAVNTCNTKIAINQNITALSLDKKLVNSDFLNYYLNTNLSKILLKRQCSIATILYINNNNLLHLYIPLPPLEKQTQIANHITQLRQQAKQLQQQAQAELAQAKQQVEQMILGEA